MTTNTSNMKNNSKQITIRLRVSTATCTPKQKANVLGLGLKKVNQKRILENTPCVRGMIKKVIHLLDVE